MKRTAGICLIILLLLGLIPSAYPEGVAAREGDLLRVASTTPMSGHFFTDLWGNNTSDMDVRALIHGYATIAWVGAGDYVIDSTVVADTRVTDSDKGKTYEFTIREDLTYNDGTPITAMDYVFSVLLLSDPRMTGLGFISRTYEHLAGFSAYEEAVLAMMEKEGEPAPIPFGAVQLLDTHRFSLTIDGAYLPYFYELTLVSAQPYPIGVIAPGCEVKDDGAGAYIAGPFRQALLMETVLDEETGYLHAPKVTSGPYTLLSYDAGAREARFARNPHYAGNAGGKVPPFGEIHYTFANPETMLDDLAADRVDILHKVGHGDTILAAMELAAKGEIRAQNYLRSGFGFISFACEEGLAASADIRRAVAMCIDTEALCLEALQGFGIPVYGYYGLGQWMVSDNQETLLMMAKNLYNLNAAREALAAAGFILDEAGSVYDEDVGGTRYRLEADGRLAPLALAMAYPEDSDIAAVLIDMLQEAAPQVGMVIEAVPLPFEEQLRHYYRKDSRTFDMFFGASNFLLAFDPYYTFHGDEAFQGIYNTTGIGDEELTTLTLAMRQVEPGDEDAYIASWLAFQARWIDVLPAVPLYSNIYFDLHTMDLQGYLPNSNWSWPHAIFDAYFGEEAMQPEEDGLEILEGEDDSTAPDASPDGEETIFILD